MGEHGWSCENEKEKEKGKRKRGIAPFRKRKKRGSRG